MKFNLKSFAAGVLVGLLGLTTLFAAPISRTINAVYSINAVTVDGKSIQFTDANKPFSVDGNTYLPVRAVAEALDKNVEYDKATATVKITSKNNTAAPIQKPAANLTVDMVTGYEKGYNEGVRSVDKWGTNTKDNAGNFHSSGIEIWIYKLGSDDYTGKNCNGMSMDIALLGNYSRLKGQFVLTEKSKNFKDEYDVTILGDGRELQTVRFKVGTLPQNLDLNVSNVQKLSFKFTNISRPNNDTGVYFGLVDVELTQ